MTHERYAICASKAHIFTRAARPRLQTLNRPLPNSHEVDVPFITELHKAAPLFCTTWDYLETFPPAPHNSSAILSTGSIYSSLHLENPQVQKECSVYPTSHCLHQSQDALGHTQMEYSFDCFQVLKAMLGLIVASFQGVNYDKSTYNLVPLP